MSTKSLIGCSIANRLMERHDTGMTGGPHIDRPGPDQVIYVNKAHQMRFIGRYCTVKERRSGGYVIKACLDEQYGHHAGMKDWLVKRLRPGWTKDQLQSACHKLFVELSEQRTLKRLREQVYTLAESLDIDSEWVDKRVAAEGREDCYNEMTPADCEFWKVELTKLSPGGAA